MTQVSHHIPSAMLAAYAAGTLAQPFALVVAAHVSMCDECRATLGAHEAAGGAVLDTLPVAAISSDLKSNVLDMLDDPFEAPVIARARGCYPAPVAQALEGQEPKWRKVALGVKQMVLSDGPEGTARLLSIPPGVAMPDHSHRGLELTLVLQGSFSDETGRFGVGDVEVADDDLDHVPVAGPEATCICLAATEGKLRFNSLVPRIFQPVFGI